MQIVKKAEKQMRREKILSAGREYAPTLYTVLVNGDDDQRQRQERKGPEFQPAPQPADDGAHRTEPGDTPAQWGDSGHELDAPHPAYQAYGRIFQTPQPHESQPA